MLQPDQQAPAGLPALRRRASAPLAAAVCGHGASGTGKTTIVAPLRRRLPGCEVFESDVILHVAALGWDTWRHTRLKDGALLVADWQATMQQVDGHRSS